LKEYSFQGPGFVKYELDKMIALGNPLATKFNNLALGAGYSTFDPEFHDLCHVVTQRLQIASSQPK
jgi:hypothetical protein